MSIKIDLAIILFIILFCFTSQLEIYLVLMIFACVHELGHLVIGLLLGFKPKEISLNPMGMRLEFKEQFEEALDKNEISEAKDTVEIQRTLTTKKVLEKKKRLKAKKKSDKNNKKENSVQIKKAIVAIAGPLTNFIIIFITLTIMYINKKMLFSNTCLTIIYANFLIRIF